MALTDNGPLSSRVRVLLVDDQPASLIAMEACLHGLDLELVKAPNGHHALRHLLAEDFAAILLDVQMPGMDGFEVARLIRGRQRSRHTPIIFLTAWESPHFSAAKAYTMGAVDYLVKPVDPTILRAKVCVFVELFRKNRQLAEQAEQLRQAQQQSGAQLSQRDKDDHDLAQFAVSLSNDLRLINDSAELLKMTSGQTLDAAGQRYVQLIGESAQHAGQLLEELLRTVQGKRSDAAPATP
jgi:PleD family two-component response regulator